MGYILHCVPHQSDKKIAETSSFLKLWSFTQNTVRIERSCYINAVINTDKNPNENNKITFVKQRCVLLTKRTYQRLERDCIQLFSQNLMVMVCQSTTLSLLKWLQHLWSLNQDNQIDSLNIESRQSDWFLKATTCCIQRWWRWWCSQTVWKAKSMKDASGHLLLYSLVPLNVEQDSRVLWKNHTLNSASSTWPAFALWAKQGDERLLQLVIPVCCTWRD